MAEVQNPVQASAPTARRGNGSALGLLTSFAVLAVLVVAFLFLLISVRDGAEAGVASLTRLLPVGYAFAAGMVASVNPCGFFMLPSFVSYQLGAEEGAWARRGIVPRLGRGLLLGAVATLGFVLVFAAIGGVIGFGGTWLVTVFPYAGLSIGVAMIGPGAWMLVTKRSIGIMAASRATVAPGRGLRNVFLFGIGYAAGSLSLFPHIHRTSALFLVGAGAYLIWYWLFYARFPF